jgi:hypothetical protein
VYVLGKDSVLKRKAIFSAEVMESAQKRRIAQLLSRMRPENAQMTIQ